MAFCASLFQRLFPHITIFLIVVHHQYGVLGCYTSIFSFGDSLADTGNLLHYQPQRALKFSLFPYGETYFQHPTGRASDGRLVIDFIAQSLGLPLVPPYIGSSTSSRNFREGVNFAVIGATALEITFFEERGIVNPFTNNSLGIQLDWFQELLPSLCSSSSGCNELLGSSLFLVGEIGGNDYNIPFFQGRSIDEIRTSVPLVIQEIVSTINKLIKHGAVTLIVPGNLPIGCSAAYLTLFQSPNEEDYDPITGCLKWLNKFSKYHNHLLQAELNQIQKLHPHATIIYADYYNAAMRLYLSPKQFGFSGGGLIACCGGGGPYNYNTLLQCGSQGSNVCNDPSLYVNWDGLHLTEAAYKQITIALLKQLCSTPHFNTSCLNGIEFRASP